MNFIITVISALIVGFIVGSLFFGGLWYTVTRMVTARRPTLLYIASFLIRSIIVLLGFFVMAQKNWQAIISCLVGFLISRIVITKWTKKNKGAQTKKIKELPHET